MPTRNAYDERRPAPRLMLLYSIRALLSGPLLVVFFPLLWFRYTTLRYRFDAEGISMRWGLLFRREVNLTYARIQDIHLTSGPLMRWMGLAELHIQTASGSASAEMVIEGLHEYEQLRDFLYQRMRGAKEPNEGEPDSAESQDRAGEDQVAGLLGDIAQDMASTRRALESLAGGDRA